MTTVLSKYIHEILDPVISIIPLRDLILSYYNHVVHCYYDDNKIISIFLDGSSNRRVCLNTAPNQILEMLNNTTQSIIVWPNCKFPKVKIDSSLQIYDKLYVACLYMCTRYLMCIEIETGNCENVIKLDRAIYRLFHNNDYLTIANIDYFGILWIIQYDRHSGKKFSDILNFDIPQEEYSVVDICLSKGKLIVLTHDYNRILGHCFDIIKRKWFRRNISILSLDPIRDVSVAAVLIEYDDDRSQWPSMLFTAQSTDLDNLKSVYLLIALDHDNLNLFIVEVSSSRNIMERLPEDGKVLKLSYDKDHSMIYMYILTKKSTKLFSRSILSPPKWNLINDNLDTGISLR